MFSLNDKQPLNSRGFERLHSECRVVTWWIYHHAPSPPAARPQEVEEVRTVVGKETSWVRLF